MLLNRLTGFIVAMLVMVNITAQKNTDTALVPKSIRSAMVRVAAWQINEFENGRVEFPKDEWQNGALYTGMVAMDKMSTDKKYYHFLYKIGEENHWQTAPNRLFADDYCVGQMYSQMYSLYKEPKMIAKFRPQADSIINFKYPDTLIFQNRNYFHAWVWCDALYMAPPALAYLSTATGNLKYLKKADTLWWKTTAFLYDTAVRLFYRDSRFFENRESNGEHVFWSRGNGWVVGGLVRMLENMPANFPSRRKYEKLLLQMSTKLASIQQKDGSWHTSLLDPNAYPIKETSGTGFFCYALAWGINHKILPAKTFLPVAQNAWKVLLSCVHPDGKLGYVQAVADSPDKVDYDSSNVYAVGAFLLAGAEMYKLQGGK
ncbi:MAG: glycoside hydrolase family 88 protein [Chitinophagaceae bacterium]